MIEVQNDRLLTITEVAAFLRVAESTIRKWDREKILKAIRIGERRDRRYRKSDVLAMLREENDADQPTL